MGNFNTFFLVIHCLSRQSVRIQKILKIWLIRYCTYICIENVYYFQTYIHFTSVQFSHSVVSDSLWPHESQHARPPYSSPSSRSSLRLMSIKSVMPSSHLILCRPLLLLPPIPPSIRVFQWVNLHMRWPKYWSFSFSIIPSKEIPGLISFVL